jgi:hypothetical protein
MTTMYRQHGICATRLASAGSVRAWGLDAKRLPRGTFAASIGNDESPEVPV